MKIKKKDFLSPTVFSLLWVPPKRRLWKAVVWSMTTTHRDTVMDTEE